MCRDTLGGRRGHLRRRHADGERAAQHARLRPVQCAQVVEPAHVAQLQRQFVLQGRGIRGCGLGRQAVLEAHGQRGLRCLAQWRGRRQRKTDEVAGHLQFGHSPPHPHGHRVGGAATGAAHQPRHQAQLLCLAQTLGGGCAARTHAHRGLPSPRLPRIHAAFQPYLAPQGASLHADQRETALAELHHAPGRVHQGRLGHKVHVVARQGDAAAHGGLVNTADGQRQAQLQFGHAGGGGPVQRPLRKPGDGRGAHQRQHVGQRAAHVGPDHHFGVLQVRDLRVHFLHPQRGIPGKAPRGVAHFHARAVKHQLPRQRRESRPGPVARVQQRRWHVAVRHVLDTRCDVEFALARNMAIGKVVQVALHAELHLAGGPRKDGVAHIVPRLRWHGERQVAMHARAIGPRQRARKVQHPRKARARRRRRRVARVPAQPRLALGVRIGKAQLAGLDRDALALDLPAHPRFQPLHGHYGLLKHAGQAQRPVGHGQLGLPTRLGEIERHLRTTEAGDGRHGVVRRQRQPCDLAANLVLLRLRQRPLPFGPQLLHQTTRRIVAHRAVHGVAQGQPARDLRQGGQVQPVGLQFATLSACLALSAVAQRQIAAGPAQAIVGHELQILGGQLKAVVQPATAHPPRHRAQRQWAQVLAQGSVDLVECHVHRAAADLAALHIHPRAHGAPALRDLQPLQIGVPVQARHVHAREVGEQLAAPALPVAAVRGQQRLAELAAQGKGCAPLGGRRGVQAHLVAARAVAQHHAHLGERQRLGATLLVGPAQRAAANRHLGLGEQPVGRRTVALGAVAEGQARDDDAPVALAAHVQLGAFDIDLLEPKAQQRARRQRHHHARQAQRLASLGVQQGHVLQLHRGDQPFAARADGMDAHRYPQCALGLLFQLRTEVADTRHNPAMQPPPGGRQQQPEGHQGDQSPSRTARHEFEKAGGMGRRLCHGGRNDGRNYDPHIP